MEPFLLSIDLEKAEAREEEEKEKEQGGLDIRTVACLGRVFLTVTPQTVRRCSSFLQRHFHECSIYVDAVALERDYDAIVALLNHGASKVFVSYPQLREIVGLQLMADITRIGWSLEDARCEGDPEEAARQIGIDLRSLVNQQDVAVHVREGDLLNAMHKLSTLDEQYPTAFVSLRHSTKETYERLITQGHVPIVPAACLTTEPNEYPNLMSAELLITTSISSDRMDGLYTTVVTNEHGICLGLVYSNQESIREALRTGRGVYKSRKRPGLWRKGDTSGDYQELVKIGLDCDKDALLFVVRQKGDGFCHLKTSTCWGPYSGLSKLERTLQSRMQTAPPGSYTARIFQDGKLLQAKIMEEASELAEAESKENVAAEAADLVYFALAKCVASGVTLADVEANLDLKSLKVTRRKGDAKAQWTERVGLKTDSSSTSNEPSDETLKEAASVPKAPDDPAGTVNGRIQMKRYTTSQADQETLKKALQRPSQRATDQIFGIVRPIIENVQRRGDAAVLEYTHKFEKATCLKTPVLHAPFPQSLMQLPPETIEAIDISFNNIHRFHSAQREEGPLQVETMPGVVCSRFSRPIESVGLYVPGGTAVLPSTALMLGVPAMVAGCKKIIMACPPRSNGTLTPEVVYVAHKVGAQSIVLAGGAQAVAAMAYGTESIAKVDKILGPGNAFVTAAKMLVSNDTNAGVSIDMPAGPSEVLVIADRSANPAFVASDLLSQAEHGTDSQVVLIAVALDEARLKAIEDELHEQARTLPRLDIVRGAIEHSVTLVVKDMEEAMRLSNAYAPEHLILQIERPDEALRLVENAGSVFVGEWTPESVGDYSAGVNHSLPTYGYARQYSGVNLASFTKHITSSRLTMEGLKNVGGAVMQLAKVEELEAHRRAVSIRLQHMKDGYGSATSGGVGVPG